MFCLALGSLSLMAASPIPESCTVGDRPFTRPLDEVGFNFDGGIKLLDGASAAVVCDGETVAVATRMEVNNYESSKRTLGSLTIFFDNQLLPKGKEYKLTVAAASIASETDDAVNEEFSSTFAVPENLGKARFDVEDGIAIDKVSRYEGGFYPCYWDIETEPVGEPSFILCREGVPVRELPANITWNRDLGQAIPQILKKMCFEKGVHFSLVLPAGSAHALYRDDIVNEEVVFNFVGGYDKQLPPLEIVWSSLFSQSSGILDVLSIRYTQPGFLVEGAKMLLYEGENETLLKEADLYVDPEGNGRRALADFGGFQMEEGKTYTFVIPEGVIISTESHPVANRYFGVFVTWENGDVDSVLEENGDAPMYDLSGRRVTSPRPGSIYIQQGKKVLVTGK